MYQRLGELVKRLLVVSLVSVLLLTSCSSAPATPEQTKGPVEPSYSKSDLLQFESAFASLRVDRDDIERNTRYFKVNYDNGFAPTIYQIDGLQPVLGIYLVYYGDSWIFWDQYIIAIDNERVAQSVSYADVARETTSSGVVESFAITDGTIGVDYSASDATLELLEKIASASSVTIRLKGESRNYDIELGDDDIELAKTMANSFKWLKWQYESSN